MAIIGIIGAARAGLAATAVSTAGLATARPAGAALSASRHPAAATVSASVSNNIVTVIGTNRGDLIALRLAAQDPNTVQVDVGDDGSAEFQLRPQYVQRHRGVARQRRRPLPCR